jgi:hypothetical protein
LLDTWLNAVRGSERDVARSLGLSRYAVRQRLNEALGRIVTSVGALSHIAPLDRQVAQATWGEQLSPGETATRLNIAPQAVRNAYARNQVRMQQALSIVQRATAHSRGSTTMSASQELLERLIGRVSKTPRDEVVLTDVTKYAVELVTYLEGSLEPFPLKAWEELDANWLSDVYGALAVGLGETEHNDIELAPLFEADQSDRQQVGDAFEQALMPAVPREIEGLLARVHPGLVTLRPNSLLNEPDVQSGGDAAKRMAAAGVTPVHLVLASDAVGLLLGRATNANYFRRGAPLSIDREDGRVRRVAGGGENFLQRAVLVEEITAMTALGPTVADALLDWLVDVAPRVVELFIGYSAADSAGNVALDPLAPDRARKNLFYRWRSSLAI